MPPSRITKEKIKQLIERNRIEIKKKQDFIQRLKNTIQIENKKISEFEGGILVLNELLTGERVE